MEKGNIENVKDILTKYPYVMTVFNRDIPTPGQAQLKIIRGSYPFLVAIAKSNFPMVELLIEKGLDVNLSDRGFRPIQVALNANNFWKANYPIAIDEHKNRKEIINLLINNGAIVETEVNSDLIYYLRNSTIINWQTREIIDILINSGANVNWAGETQSPLGYLAAQWNNSQVDKNELKETISFLIKKGALLNDEEDKSHLESHAPEALRYIELESSRENKKDASL